MAFAPPDRAQGVFETLLVRDGRVHALTGHLRRLADAVAGLYGAELPDSLATEIRAHVADCRGEHRLRVDAVPRREPGRAPPLAVRLRTAPVAANRPRAFRCVPVIVEAPGGLGPHKWRDRGFVDGLRAGDPAEVALLVDGDGRVLEAAWANVWRLDGERLVTPPADGRLLPGVTRARLLALAATLGYEAAEEAIALAALTAESGIFLTSSIALAVPASLGPPPGADPAIERIRAALAAGDWS